VGNLVFYCLKVMTYEWFILHDEKFSVWCDFGYTCITPTFPRDFSVITQLFDDTVLSSFGFLIMVHFICLSIVSSSKLISDLAKRDSRVLEHMHGKVVNSELNTETKGKEFRPLSRALWIKTFGEKAKEEFDRYDIDNNGTLSKAEWDDLCQAQADFASLDEDHTGTVTREEYVLAHPDMELLFDLMDADKSGSITESEYRHMAASINEFRDAICNSTEHHMKRRDLEAMPKGCWPALTRTLFEERFSKARFSKKERQRNFDNYNRVTPETPEVSLMDYAFVESLTERFLNICDEPEVTVYPDMQPMCEKPKEEKCFNFDQLFAYWKHKFDDTDAGGGDTKDREQKFKNYVEKEFKKMDEGESRLVFLSGWLSNNTIGLEAKLIKDELRTLKHFSNRAQEDLAEATKILAGRKEIRKKIGGELDAELKAMNDRVKRGEATTQEKRDLESHHSKVLSKHDRGTMEKVLSGQDTPIKRLLNGTQAIKTHGMQVESEDLTGKMKEDREEKSMHRVKRLAVIKRLITTVSWRDKTSLMKETVSAIVVANCYEDLYEGLVAFITNDWHDNAEPNCFSKVLDKFRVTALLWAGTILISFAYYLLVYFMKKRFIWFHDDTEILKQLLKHAKEEEEEEEDVSCFGPMPSDDGIELQETTAPADETPQNIADGKENIHLRLRNDQDNQEGLNVVHSPTATGNNSVVIT